MNELELGAGEDRNMSNKDELSHMTDKLNGLIDSLISKSDLHWVRYRELAEECETHAFCPSSLEGMEEICERTEGLARDLLCYSLGRFRRRDL